MILKPNRLTHRENTVTKVMGVIVTFAASQIAALLNTVDTYQANSLEL